MNNDIQIEINVPVSAASAYSEISRVSDWWTRNTDGEASQVGNAFTVRFKDTFVSFEVTDAEQDSRYVWHVQDCFLHWLENKTEWKNSDVIFDITSTGNGSHVLMTHRGLNEKTECYADCKSGWEHFVATSLYNLITTGVGMPEGEEVMA